MRTLLSLTVLSVVFVGLAAVGGNAAVITLTLDDVTLTANDCGVICHEAECAMHFAETTNEDILPGFCFFNPDANNWGKEGVYIWPARLVLDLTNVENVESVEVDIYETHEGGSTRAFLYGESGLIDSMVSFQEDDQTLVVSAGGQTPVSLAVSAQESYVWEIRLIGADVAPVAGVTFGSIKALYR